MADHDLLGAHDAVAPSAERIRIEAETFGEQRGVQTEPTSDVGGGRNVGWMAAGDWMRFDSVDFGAGFNAVDLRVASAVTTSGSLQVRLDGMDGHPVAEVSMRNTGGWQSWRTVTAEFSQILSGEHDVYIRVVNPRPGQDVGNLNWFELKAAG